MMPDGLLDDIYPSFGGNNSDLHEAFNLCNDDHKNSKENSNDGSDYENENNDNDNFNFNDLMHALPCPDEGNNENVSNAPDIDVKILPRMVDYVDDPLEMTIQDYLKSLDVSSEGKLNTLVCLINVQVLINVQGGKWVKIK